MARWLWSATAARRILDEDAEDSFCQSRSGTTSQMIMKAQAYGPLRHAFYRNRAGSSASVSNRYIADNPPISTPHSRTLALGNAVECIVAAAQSKVIVLIALRDSVTACISLIASRSNFGG